MKQVLHTEIAKERCNAKSLGGFNRAVEYATKTSLEYNENNTSRYSEPIKNRIVNILVSKSALFDKKARDTESFRKMQIYQTKANNFRKRASELAKFIK